MFKAKKLDKLVAAGIISQTQKLQILDYEDSTGGMALVMKALTALGIFTVGLGVVSLIASNWHEIERWVKLAVMFALLFGVGGMAWYYKARGRDAMVEKLLLGEFFLSGATIGLIIQAFQLSGGKIYAPLELWSVVTLPLLFVAKQKLVSCFWVPLFLVWSLMFIFDNFDEVGSFEWGMAFFAALALLGRGIEKTFADFSAGRVLKKEALVAMYLVLTVYVLLGGFDGISGLADLVMAVVVLGALSFVFGRFKEYRLVRRNIKLGGLVVAMLYINLGTELGLFETGAGLIISGALLLLLLKIMPNVVRLAHGEKNNA